MQALEHVVLRATEVVDLAPLERMKNLTYLDVVDTSVSDQEISEFKRFVPTCYVER